MKVAVFFEKSGKIHKQTWRHFPNEAGIYTTDYYSEELPVKSGQQFSVYTTTAQ